MTKSSTRRSHRHRRLLREAGATDGGEEGVYSEGSRRLNLDQGGERGREFPLGVVMVLGMVEEGPATAYVFVVIRSLRRHNSQLRTAIREFLFFASFLLHMASTLTHQRLPQKQHTQLNVQDISIPSHFTSLNQCEARSKRLARKPKHKPRPKPARKQAIIYLLWPATFIFPRVFPHVFRLQHRFVVLPSMI